MNDDERPPALDHLDDLDVGRPPVGDLLHAGHAAKRRRRTVIASVAAVILVGGGFATAQVMGENSSTDDPLVTDSDDPDTVAPDATYGVTVSASRDPDSPVLYEEGALAQVGLVRDGSQGRVQSETASPPWSRSWTGLEPGDYVIRAAARPCAGSCDYLDPPTDTCEQAITLDTDLRVDVEFTNGKPCAITVTPDDRADAEVELPTSYRFVLSSLCGERPLIWQYRVVVRNGTVVSAEPMGRPNVNGPSLDEIPTLADLLDKALDAGPEAVVGLEVDGDGVPVSLSIDHNPDEIDDEECYEVLALRPL